MRGPRLFDHTDWAGVPERSKGKGGSFSKRALLIPTYSQLSSTLFFNTVKQKLIFNRARVVSMSHT